MSLSLDLCWSNVTAIRDALGLVERHGADTDAYLELTSAMSPHPVGSLRWFQGEVNLVYVGLTVEPIPLDSHMMFAFTQPDSPIPHFTVDSVRSGEGYAFHLDLIPRVDLGAHLAYMDCCFVPLTSVREQTLEMPGLTRAHLDPRQWALMSEWMLAHRADEEAFRQVPAVVDAYRQHWLGLVADGVSDAVLDGVTAANIQQRNAANLGAIFNPEVDKVWANVERLVGHEQSERVRSLLLCGGTSDGGQ